ncbi:MAG: patatin-like phospholipase family protein [Bacteroidota bacterium]
MITCNLVLSGGGARGFAHLGIIKALQEKEVMFSSISATSSGAIIGAFLCDGYTPDEIADICSGAIPLTHFNFHLSPGILSIDSLHKLFAKYLRSKTFSDLKYPLYISVTDLNDGKQVILNQGNIVEAVIASASIPIIFPPVFIGGVPYADGGLSGNLPVEPFIGSTLKTIGVHVNKTDRYDGNISIIRQFERMVHLSIREIVLREMNYVDLLIEPDGLAGYGLFDTKKISDIIKTGYDFTKHTVVLDALTSQNSR